MSFSRKSIKGIAFALNSIASSNLLKTYKKSNKWDQSQMSEGTDTVLLSTIIRSNFHYKGLIEKTKKPEAKWGL